MKGVDGAKEKNLCLSLLPTEKPSTPTPAPSSTLMIVTLDHVPKVLSLCHRGRVLEGKQIVDNKIMHAHPAFERG